MTLYNRSERSHIAVKTWTDSGSSVSVAQPANSGSISAPLAKDRGTIGLLTRDRSRYAKAEMLSSDGLVPRFRT
jgi:hypothetical protein